MFLNCIFEYSICNTELMPLHMFVKCICECHKFINMELLFLISGLNLHMLIYQLFKYGVDSLIYCSLIAIVNIPTV